MIGGGAFMRGSAEFEFDPARARKLLVEADEILRWEERNDDSRDEKLLGTAALKFARLTPGAKESIAHSNNISQSDSTATGGERTTSCRWMKIL